MTSKIHPASGADSPPTNLFQASAIFAGPREGFFFSTGEHGTGYYVDDNFAIMESVVPVEGSDRAYNRSKTTSTERSRRSTMRQSLNVSLRSVGDFVRV